jgi:DNA-binding MarR family transcriptional regulator
MTRGELERMAEGIVRLRAEIIRRRGKESELPGGELTTPQALALRAIVLGGPFRMGELASELGVSVATASRTVDALAARDLVKRESDPADARAVNVSATAHGRREWSLRRERFVRALERLMDDLSEHERRQLSESLETLNRLFGSRGTRQQQAS